MASYAIVDFDMRDPGIMREYIEQVPAIIHKYGGRYLARGGKTEILEGDWEPNLVVIVEFPSQDQAMRFFNCDEYKQFKEARHKAGPSNMILVEGV
jgi:uncharacterized protein (DUF1330 family)